MEFHYFVSFPGFNNTIPVTNCPICGILIVWVNNMISARNSKSYGKTVFLCQAVHSLFSNLSHHKHILLVCSCSTIGYTNC